jgi:hypothetical protein
MLAIDHVLFAEQDGTVRLIGVVTARLEKVLEFLDLGRIDGAVPAIVVVQDPLGQLRGDPDHGLHDLLALLEAEPHSPILEQMWLQGKQEGLLLGGGLLVPHDDLAAAAICPNHVVRDEIHFSFLMLDVF